MSDPKVCPGGKPIEYCHSIHYDELPTCSCDAGADREALARAFRYRQGPLHSEPWRSAIGAARALGPGVCGVEVAQRGAAREIRHPITATVGIAWCFPYADRKVPR